MRNYLLFSLIIMMGLIVSIITGNLTIFFFNAFFLSLGYSIIFVMMNKTRGKAYLLFGVFYLISFTYTATTDIRYIENPYVDYFVTPDSVGFYIIADQISESDGFFNIFLESIDKFEATGGYIASISVLTYFAKMIDGTHSIILKLFSVFSAGIVTVLLFFVLLKLVDEEKAFRSALAFSLFSVMFFQSALILRDINIMLFFSIMFYILIEYKRNVFGTVFTILLIYITYLFRPEHGLFSLIFLFFNLFYYAKEKSFTKYIYFIFAGAVFLITLISFQATEQLEETTNDYLEYSEGKGDFKSEKSSLGSALYSLPTIIRVLAVAGFSQLTPLPVWAPISMNRAANPFRLTQSISGFFWYFVWCFIIVGFVFKKYKTYPKHFFYLLVISILLIFAATSEMNVRRIMVAYPILYCFAVYSFYSFRKQERVAILSYSFFFYASLHVVYLFMKI